MSPAVGEKKRRRVILTGNNQSPASGSWTHLNWVTEVEDPDGLHAANVITLPAIIPTRSVRVALSVGFAGHVTGERSLALMLNGAPGVGTALAYARQPSHDEATEITLHINRLFQPGRFAAGDLLAAYVYQTSGGGLALSAGAEYGHFSIEY